MSRNLECQSLNGGKVGVLEKFLGNISYIQWGAKMSSQELSTYFLHLFSSMVKWNGLNVNANAKL